MIKIPTYTSKNVEVSWASHSFVGFAPDSFIEIAPSTDITDEEVSADGSVAISFLPDETGTVTISLQQNSPSNHFLARVTEIQRQDGDIASSDMTIVDPSGSVVALIKDAHIKTRPTMTRGSTATGSTMDWVFFSQQIHMQATEPSNVNAATLIADAVTGADLIQEYLLG